MNIVSDPLYLIAELTGSCSNQYTQYVQHHYSVSHSQQGACFVRIGFAGRLMMSDAPKRPKKTEFTELFRPLHLPPQHHLYRDLRAIILEMSEPLPSVTVADADGDGIVKRTRRPALSCVECRMRKVKCDREKPCGGCIKIGSSRCTYRPSRSAARAISERSSSSTSGSRGGHRGSTQSSLHEPTSSVNQYDTTNLLSGQTRAHPRPSIPKEPRAPTEPRPRAGATSSVSVSVTENGASQTSITNETASEHGTGRIKGNITDYPGSFQKSKFFGQSHWMNALEPVSAIL